jgi:dCMP deaminase
MNKRPSKIEYYLNIAKEVAQRSTCLRRRFGAIIVKEDQIISAGYVGSPRGAANCIDIGTCEREKLQIPSGERYELCRSVHAELNAIINAARAGVSLLGGRMYLYGENMDGTLIAELKSCQMCRRAIINAGIDKLVILTKDGIKEFIPKSWIDSEDISIKGY